MTTPETPHYLSTYPLSPSSALGPYRRADYVRLPDEPRCELIYGHLYLPPSNTVVHQTALLRLTRIFDAAEKSGGIYYFAPLDVYLFDHTVVQPDLLFLSPQRLDAQTETGIDGPPDLVAEVLGPGSARRDRNLKLSAYAEAGVPEFWILDPEIGHIDFLVNSDGSFRLVLPIDGVYTSPVFPDLRLPLQEFWDDFERRLPEHLRSTVLRDRLRPSLPGVSPAPSESERPAD